MTPEKEQALKAHLTAIAEILYQESDPKTLKTLEDIEVTVREHMQTHIGPELGGFLSQQLAEKEREKYVKSKAQSEN